MEWIVGIYLLNFIILVALVCFERRDPVVSLAWVMGFTLFPVIGVIIFLVFGKGLKKKTAKKYAEKWRMNIDLTEKMQRDEELRYFGQKDEFGKLDDLVLYLLNTNNSIYTENNAVKVYNEAREHYIDLLDDINAAKKSINMLYFIIRDDNISRRIVSALAKKASEGVEVRLLYDDFGCLTTNKRVFAPLIEAGGRVCAFFPVKLGSYSKINHRNHRKIVVIDNEIGYMGGMNIGDEYMGLKKPSPWRDTHIKISGDAVMYLQKTFMLDWLFSTGEDLSVDLHRFFERTQRDWGRVGIQIVSSGPDTKDEPIKCGMIKMISSAKKTVYLQTPYFVPDKPFLTAIEMAAKSGVDIRVMIPGIPDKKYVYYSTCSFIGELLEAGIKVYKYPGFLHSKTLSIDGETVTIGTSNADIRSFQLHFEINAFIYNSDVADEYNKSYAEDMKLCTEVTKEQYNKRGVWQQMKEGFFRLFSPIM